jgi:DNA-binding XRE family transcriptional regulator
MSPAVAEKKVPKGEATRKAGQPPNYLRLKAFFPAQTDLATALGVNRETIRTWNRGEMIRLRRTSIDRVRVLAAIADQVARYMPTEASVGSWLLSPQPALGGEIPVDLVKRDDPDAYTKIVGKAAAIAEPVSVGTVDGLPEETELLDGIREQRGDDFADEVMALAPAAEDPDEDPDFPA